VEKIKPENLNRGDLKFGRFGRERRRSRTVEKMRKRYKWGGESSFSLLVKRG